MEELRRLDYHAHVLSKPAPAWSCLSCRGAGFAQSENMLSWEEVKDGPDSDSTSTLVS